MFSSSRSAGDFQPKSAPLPPALCREIAPKRRGGREWDIGDPPLGEKRSGSGRRPGRVLVFVPGEGLGVPGPVSASPPARPSRCLAAAGSPGGGGAAPHNFKEESVFSSSPTPHQRIKKIKHNRGKDFVFFFPARLSLTWGRSPQSPLAALRSPPKPHPAAPSAQPSAEPIPLYSPFAFHWEK